MDQLLVIPVPHGLAQQPAQPHDRVTQLGALAGGRAHSFHFQRKNPPRLGHEMRSLLYAGRKHLGFLYLSRTAHRNCLHWTKIQMYSRTNSPSSGHSMDIPYSSGSAGLVKSKATLTERIAVTVKRTR